MIHKLPTTYEYIGPSDILKRIKPQYKGATVTSIQDIKDWINHHQPTAKAGTILTCTFIINLDDQLVITDRHAEHVQCALGNLVKSAGEINFYIAKRNKIQIDSITNQSTGYCPHATSWKSVKIALEKVFDTNIPDGFDPEFIFSYCSQCQTRQIVKDEFYFCPTCHGTLLDEYAFQVQRKQLEFK